MATAGVASSASINALRIRPCFQPSSKPKSLLSFSISTPSFLLLRSSSQSTSLSHPPSLLFHRSSDLRTKAAAAAAPMASSSLPYERELAVAKKAASLAARLCQTVQKALLQSDVQSKSDKSPVTVADYGSQALVSFVLEKELQSFSLVAEEDSGDLRKDESQETLKRITKLVNETISSDGGYNISPLSVEDVLTAIDRGQSEGGPHGRHWVLDPIDGTKGFLRGDQYAIALALLHEGRVVLGVLACPNLPLASIGCPHQPSLQNEVGCLFSARIGAGTDMQLLDGSSAPTKVYVTAIENPSEASFFESFEAAHSMHDLSSSIAKKLGVQAPPVRIDSQAKYGALSRGDGAIYLRFPHKGYREKIWDHAAGCIVVTEAGGVVTDAAGNPLDFSKGKYLDLEKGIIVTNQKLMPVLLNAVQDAVREQSQAASTL
ncbi:SAL1 phosphatase-like [Magnolia sinica]|uniref:SAL1 phosphatase-like n=1 Tax=Magnolia sinica TaxID=86752 RepID=UPI00265972C1|nr:SAL1 phosphatase-like [Magnolia sinica]